MTEPKKTFPPLWQHQQLAIEKASDPKTGNRFALFFDPGCGKSRTAIELFKKNVKYYKFQPVCASAVRSDKEGKSHAAYMKAIIFAPLNVCRNWENELEEYLDVPYQTFLVAGQTKSKKLITLQEFRDAPSLKHSFLICNIEALRSKEYRALISKCGATFMIVDESHNFKTPTSLQTKGLFEVVHSLKPKFLYLLTGTPAPQGEIDLWSSFVLLGKTKDNFFVWRKRYFDDKNERRRGTQGYWPDYRIRATSKEYFRKLLLECSVSAQKNQVLDLPPLLRTNIYAELGPEQKRHYETMKEFLFAVDKEGNELNASNLLSRTLRLQQILAGFLGDVPVKENPRLDALDAAIQKTQGEQFIVWTIFKATYKQLGERLKVNFGLLTGEQSAEERFNTMEEFQAGKIHALIAHPKAGGVGVNLTKASYSIHYTRNYSLVDDLQTEARNYRGGSEIHERITRIDIITPDTIDEDITTALREKKSIQDFILGLKEKRDGRYIAA